MTRRATAVLEVQVQDQQLDQHLVKLDAVRSAWDFLGTHIGSMTSAFSKGTGDELKKVSSALSSMANVKGGSGAPALLQALTDTAPHLANLATEIDKVATATKKVANDSVRWARALTKAATEVGRLETHTDSLVNSQQRTSAHMQQFEQHLDVVTGKLKNQGAQMLQLIQAYAGFNKAVIKNAGSGGGGKKTESFGGFMAGLAQFERFFIRNATSLFIAGMWLKHTAEAFRDAAVQLDLESVLGRSVENFAEIMERTKKATGGMVSDLQIMKSAALMSSFGIPMEHFAQNMALVQKMAVRTGQDTTYMFDSLARGVSRLSPAILDNLGIQIKLNDAYQAQAATLGIGLDKLDKQQKKVAVLNEVIRQMSDMTQEVDPAASLQARLDKMETGLTNFFQKLKGGILDTVMLLAATEEERLAIISDRLKLHMLEMKKYGHAVSETAKDVLVATEVISQKGLDSQLRWRAQEFTVEAIIQGRKFIEVARETLVEEGKVYDVRGKSEAQNERMLQQVKLREDREKYAQGLLRERKSMLEILADSQARLNHNMVDGIVLIPSLDAAIRRNMDAAMAWFLRYEGGIQTVVGLNREIEKMQGGLAGEAAKIGGMEGKSYQSGMQDALADAQYRLNELASLAARDTTGLLPRILFGADGHSGAMSLIINLKEIDKQQRKISAENAERYRREHAGEMATLRNWKIVTEMRQQELDMLKGQSRLQIDLNTASDALTKALKEQEEIRSKTVAAGAAEGDYTMAQAVAADLAVIELQHKYELLLRINKTTEGYAAFLKSGKNGAQELADLEWKRLSHGKSRLQIEAELMRLSKVQLAMEQARDKLAKDQTKEALAEFFIASVKAAGVQTAIANAQALLDKMPTYGGGGAKKEKSSGIPEFKKDGKELHAVWQTFVDSGDQYMTEFFDGTKDKFGNLVKQVRAQLFSVEDGGQGLMGSLLFGNAAGALEQNEKRIEVFQQRIEEIKKLMSDPESIWFGPEGDQEIAKLKGWIATLTDANQPLIEHLKNIRNITQGMNDWADANQWAFDSAQGLIGDDFIAGFTGLGNAVKDVSDKLQQATRGEASGYDVLLAGMGGIRAFTNAFIKDRRDRAKIEMFMNGAAAFAAAGYGNWPAAAAHAQAAIMYGLVAGGKVRLPSEARKNTKDADTGKGKGGPLHIHIHTDEVAMTDAERGALVNRAREMAAAEGYSSYG